MILHGIFLVAILRSDGAMTAQDSKISSTIPSAYGLFGYHQAYISKHNASVLTAQLQARAGSTAVARPLPVSTEVATTVAGAKDASVAVAPVQAQAEGAQSRPQASRGMPSSHGPSSRAQTSSVPGRSVTTVNVSAARVFGIPGSTLARSASVDAVTSSTMGQGSLLRKDERFVPAKTDFNALSNSSVGGNGLPRPYGRFLAGREGNGLAVWERLPPYHGLERTQSSPGRNISRINVEKGRLLQRNLNHDTHPIANLYAPGGADRLENWTDDLKETDIFSRRRPGRGVLQNPAASYTEEEAERLPPVGATFLVRVPSEVPESVKVDDSYSFERAFLHPLRGHRKGSKRVGKAFREGEGPELPPLRED